MMTVIYLKNKLHSTRTSTLIFGTCTYKYPFEPFHKNLEIVPKTREVLASCVAHANIC